MATLAEEFFREREAVPPGARQLFEAIRTNRLRQRIARWLGREALPGRSPYERLKLYYRGQSNSTWGLSSTLFRQFGGEKEVTEARLSRAETAVLHSMRSEGLGHKMTNGELLMVLQHHEIPTRLLDFCLYGLPALYFAVCDETGADGRLFVVGQRVDADGSYPKLSLSTDVALPWVASPVNDWRGTVACVDDPSLDPRMKAQDGCFLVGGTLQRHPGEHFTIGSRQLSAIEWQQITTLRIYFPLPKGRKPVAKKWPAVGWTVRIPAAWKEELRDLLASVQVTRDHLFPDYDGCRRLGRHVASEAR